MFANSLPKRWFGQRCTSFRDKVAELFPFAGSKVPVVYVSLGRHKSLFQTVLLLAAAGK